MKSNPFKDLPQEYFSFFWGIFGVVFAGVFIVYIFYLKNLQDLLKNVRPANRKMAPAKVWLVLVSFLGLFLIIPEVSGISLSPLSVTVLTIMRYGLSVFTLVWNFYMVNKISESVAAELTSRNINEATKPAYNIGMFMCACNTLALVAGLPYLAGIGTVASIAGFVAWIMYWVKTNEYKIKLRSLSVNDQFDF